MSKRQDRADRLLIIVALVILFMAGAAYYFDGWMWGAKRERGSQIGSISGKTGDVRVKFEGDLKWGKAARGQDLVYNDSIYAGSDSQAELALGQSQMTVQENTLIVLRREKDVSFLNLDYGTLFGKVAKNDKIVIDTGAGKPIELVPTSNAQIVLRKTHGGKTELNVLSGRADITINGKKQSVTTASKVILDEQAPRPVVEALRLIALKPLKDQTVYSAKPMDIPFRWEWSNKRPAQAGERFTLEFAVEPTFQKIHARKEVVGRLEGTMHASQSLTLFYRIRGPRSELSQTERLNFVRLTAPVIVRPVANQKFVVPSGQKALVETEFQKTNAAVWYQVASDEVFSAMLVNQSTRDSKVVSELGVGHYFLRARHDFGDGRLSDWSKPVPFVVEAQLEPLKLSGAPSAESILIPNKPYPASLYRASAAKVREYLAKKHFLADFFGLTAGSFDKLNVEIDGQAAEQVGTEWPARALSPGRYAYKYQAQKSGFAPSESRGPSRLEIAMEPPRAQGKVNFAAPLEDGSREAQAAFTPLLFARSYDVEISRDASFKKTQQIRTDVPEMRATLNPGAYYWRARARDAQGKIISAYSTSEKFEVPRLATPPALADNAAPAVDRKPTATESSVMRIEEKPAEAWVRNGWYAWAGSGYNYVDMRQSVQERGTATSYGAYPGGRYFEGGFNSATGWGGAVSYKSTPGKVETKNAVIDEMGYTWSVLGVEGYKRNLAYIPFTNIPFVYGMRVGMQQHKTPFVFLNANADLNLKQNKMNTASFGISAEIRRARWTYYWLTRYQYPFSSEAGGSNTYQIKPTFAFDGSVGTSYNLTERLKLGLFWYGQWHQYDFVYGDTEVTNTGFQSLFYSSFDLRFGFEF